MKNVVDRCWRIFISLKLTFISLTVLGIGAFIGMFFDQTISYEQFVKDNQNNNLAGILSFFELYDSFHSWWFSLAILVLALNLIACSIERLPRIYFDYRHPRRYLSKRRMAGLPLSTIIDVKDRQQAEDLLANFFTKPLAQHKLAQGSDYYYQEQQGLGRFGVYIVHIALLIVMFSAMYATQNGVDGHVQIEEGKQVRFITARGASGVTYPFDLGFDIGCADFRLRTFVDNSPMEYESDLYIASGDQHVITKTVRVNEPLTYAGFTFYQSTYRPIISEQIVTVEITSRHGDSVRHRVKLNTPIVMPSGHSFTVEKIFEDFGGIGSAIRIAQKNPQGESTYFHVFRRYKDYDRIVRNDDFSVSFIDTDQLYETGLSVGYVPGIQIIFLGFAIFVIGLYMCFFMMPVRWFARIVSVGSVTQIWLSSSGFRMPVLVKEAFDKKINAIILQRDHHA